MNGDDAGVWKTVHVTSQPAANITVYLDTGAAQTSFETSVELSTTSIDSVTIGNGFTGFMQDLRVYTPVLMSEGSQVVVPNEGAFLPQCLCPPELDPLQSSCVNTTSTVPRCVYSYI